jgi:hypothetical protein
MAIAMMVDNPERSQEDYDAVASSSVCGVAEGNPANPTWNTYI